MSIPYFSVALLFSAGLSLLGQERLEPGLARVTVRVFDPWGERLDGAFVDLIAKDGRNLGPMKSGSPVARIPWGSYRLRARTAGPGWSRAVEISSANVYLMIAIPFLPGDSEQLGDSLKVQGRVEPAQATGSFVRLRGVFLDHQAEGEIDGTGRFSVGGLFQGSYAVEIFSPTGRLLAARSIALDSRDPVREVTIRISSGQNLNIE